MDRTVFIFSAGAIVVILVCALVFVSHYLPHEQAALPAAGGLDGAVVQYFRPAPGFSAVPPPVR